MFLLLIFLVGSAMSVEPSLHAHCCVCFKSACPGGAECAIVTCPGCDVRMHSCKLDDHQQYICAMTLVTCPNAFYGCTIKMGRYMVNEHIQHCPASLVFCPFIRTRQFVSKSAKKILKRIAKGRCVGPPSPLKNASDHFDQQQPDIVLAHTDQLTIQQAFRIPRAQRFSLNFALRRSELEQLLKETTKKRNSVNNNNNNNECTTTVEDEDSSDEEAKINANKYRAMREPFAGCRICEMDPGSQHLHQLGSLSFGTAKQREKIDQQPKFDQFAKTSPHDDLFAFLPTFSRQNALFITHSWSQFRIEDVMPRRFMRTDFPVFACDEFVRRDHYSDHCAAHSAFEDDKDGLAFFARCPNAQYGCQFSTDQLLKTVDGGVIKLNSFLGLVVHVPMPLLPQQCSPATALTGGTSFVQLDDHFLTILGPFLDDASLRSLSSTCRRLRHLLPSLMRNRLSVERLFFGASQCVGAPHRFLRLQMQPRTALIEHLRTHCKFSNQHSIYDEDWIRVHKKTRDTLWGSKEQKIVGK